MHYAQAWPTPATAALTSRAFRLGAGSCVLPPSDDRVMSHCLEPRTHSTILAGRPNGILDSLAAIAPSACANGQEEIALIGAIWKIGRSQAILRILLSG